MIRRFLARLLFRLGVWLDPDHAPAVYGLPRARALALPEPTPDELLDESLAGRSEMTDHDCPECGAGADDDHHAKHCSGYIAPAPKPKPEPLQCAVAKGSEYTTESLPFSLPIGLKGPTTIRRYKSPYHVVVDGRLACDPDWEPEPNIPTHSVLHVQEIRLCRAPACRALWQPERDRARAEKTA
jgi:hypothetical protein